MNTKKFYRKKYRELLYQTPMGKLITELIIENKQELLEIVNRIHGSQRITDPEKVAREVLVAMIWGLGIAKEGEEIDLSIEGVSLSKSYGIYSHQGFAILVYNIDNWLESLLFKYASEAKGLTKN